MLVLGRQNYDIRYLLLYQQYIQKRFMNRAALVSTDVGIPSGSTGSCRPIAGGNGDDVHIDRCTDHVECFLFLMHGGTAIRKNLPRIRYIAFLFRVYYPIISICDYCPIYMSPATSQMSPSDTSGEELEANHSSRLYRNPASCLDAGFIKCILKRK